jgi:hypothetical protein
MNTTDLGFSMQQDNLDGLNLFEAFSANKGDIAANDPSNNSTTPASDQNQNQQNTQAASPAIPLPPELKPENQAALGAMMNEFFTKGATPSDGAASNPQSNGAQGAAAAASTTPADQTPKSQIQVVYEFFRDKKILEEVDGFDGSEQMMEAALRQTIDKRLPDAVTQHIEQTFASRPQQAAIAKDFYNHLANGGTVSDFVTLNSDRSIDPAAFDNADKTIATSAAEQSIVNYYTELGWKPEAINTHVKTLKAMGDDVLIQNGKVTHEQWSELNKQRRDQHNAALQQNMTRQTQQMQERNQKIESLIDAGGEFFGVKLDTPQKKQQAKDFIFKASVPDPTVPGKMITPYVAKLRAQASTPEHIMAQAIMLMEGSEGIKQALTNQGKTQALSDLEKKLADINTTQNRAAAQGSSSTPVTNTGNKEPKAESAYFDIDVLPLR